ncbi:MAG TPA: DUF4190 domain-containing protein [Candidatus Glassbacteria bacterium]|nr:DUF4190 domain-containing protein [Candidatus Glassbacteria bacterium]
MENSFNNSPTQQSNQVIDQQQFTAIPQTPYSATTQSIYVQQPAPVQGNAAATISLIFGILGCTGFLPLIGSIVALISGFIGLFKPYKKGTAIFGFVLGIIGTIAWMPLLYFVIIPLL